MTCRRRREVGDNKLRNIRTDVIRHLYAQEWIPLLALPHSVDKIYGGDIMELCVLWTQSGEEFLEQVH